MLVDDPAPRGYISAMIVTPDKPEDMIFYNRDFMKPYHDAPNNKKTLFQVMAILLN